jgi:hypothetical protein
MHLLAPSCNEQVSMDDWNASFVVVMEPPPLFPFPLGFWNNTWSVSLLWPGSFHKNRNIMSFFMDGIARHPKTPENWMKPPTLGWIMCIFWNESLHCQLYVTTSSPPMIYCCHFHLVSWKSEIYSKPTCVNEHLPGCRNLQTESVSATIKDCCQVHSTKYTLNFPNITPP